MKVEVTLYEDEHEIKGKKIQKIKLNETRESRRNDFQQKFQN